jgi:hypothetical protein
MSETVASRPAAGTRLKTKAPSTKALLAGGVAAAPLFNVVAALQILTREGFDFRRHPISLLSVGDRGWIQIANFVVSGLLIIGLAIAARRLLHPGRAGTWGPLLIGLFGLGLVAGGVFVTDPALGFPAGTPEGIGTNPSWHATLHGYAPMVAIIAATIACFVFVRRFAGLRQWGWAIYCAAMGVAVPLTVMWPTPVDTYGVPEGISIRLAAGAALAFIWAASIALRLRSEE